MEEEVPSASKALESLITRMRHDAASGDLRTAAEYAAVLREGDGSPAETVVNLGAHEPRSPGAHVHDADATRELRTDDLSDASRQEIGPYRVIEELGRGGQGVVYLAEDMRFSRHRVALKVLERGAPPELLQRFRREAEIATRLNHPNICAFKDAGTAEGVAYIAMQHVPGTTLAQVLTSSKTVADKADVSTSSGEGKVVPPAAASGHHQESAHPSTASKRTRIEIDRILEIVEKAARALHAAHEQGVVHRDVKPGNIMVRSDGEPVILDFGLARIEEGDFATLTREGDMFGTPAYMSPEQITGDARNIDRRTDVWSLGVTLYEGLTLTRPFTAPTRVALYREILTNEPLNPKTLAPSLPTDARWVLATALEKNRERRYQTALDFAEDLRRLRLREPIAARPVTSSVRFRRWIERNPALSSALLLAALVLVAGTITSLLFAFSSERNAREAERQMNAARAAALREREERENVLRLSATLKTRMLREEAETLWPLHPDLIPRFEDWLLRARSLIAPLDQPDPVTGAPSHRAQLAQIRARAKTSGPPTWTFTTEEDAWWHDQLQTLVSDLDALAHPESGLIEGIAPGAGLGVRRRLELTRAMEEASVRARDASARWQQAIERIAKSPHYDGLICKPQVGLIPIGPDPTSGLEEFAELSTGRPSVRDPHSGRLDTDESSSLVFVLLPGGTFLMGAQRDDSGAPNFDPQAETIERPVHSVALAPFFLSKFEMTQGQWERITGNNPSFYRPGNIFASKDLTLFSPVESVSHYDCQRVMTWLGYALPTECQWEYACRGGTQSPWSCPLEHLVHAANLADASCKVNGGHPSATYEAWDDGYTTTAPGNAFRGNPFGLHHMHGNVWEWCADPFSLYASPPRAGDGLRSDQSLGAYVARGGSFGFPSSSARSATRFSSNVQFSSHDMGLRPSRPLHP
jgi:serine/threonine protein kinase/formylglycine-generating enzyme required for sulfatase activity